MANFTVRNLEQKFIRRLKEQAAEHGVSVNEELLRILRAALPEKIKPKMNFKEFLISGPPWSDDFCEIMDQIVKDRRRS